MKKKYIWIAIIAYIVLIVPPIIYLCWLIPNLTEEYNTMLASGGVIGGAAFYGASKIPDTVKFSGLFKTASRSYTLLIISILVKEFYIQCVALVAIIISCYIVFKILKGIYYDRKREFENKQFAKEISSSLNERFK